MRQQAHHSDEDARFLRPLSTSMNMVHIGLPKAASTTLQNRLFANQPHYAYVGRIDNSYRNERTRELIERITFQDSLEYDHGAAQALLYSLPEVVAEREKPILVSAESFSVEGRADRRLIAERLHRLFAPAKVLIVLRAQPSMLQSLYLNHLRASGQPIMSFGSWLDASYGTIRYPELQRVALNYEPLVRAYEDIFGPDQVVVLPFELIREENSEFSRRLAELLQMPAPGVQASLSKNLDNQRMSRRQLAALHLQNYLPSGTNLALMGRRILPNSVYLPMRDFARGGNRVKTPHMPESWRDRIVEKCASGNAQIEARKNIPLAILGYPVATKAVTPELNPKL
jgi:hypothetical protein